MATQRRVKGMADPMIHVAVILGRAERDPRTQSGRRLQEWPYARSSCKQAGEASACGSARSARRPLGSRVGSRVSLRSPENDSWEVSRGQP